jgi:hypothetical protein
MSGAQVLQTTGEELSWRIFAFRGHFRALYKCQTCRSWGSECRGREDTKGYHGRIGSPFLFNPGAPCQKYRYSLHVTASLRMLLEWIRNSTSTHVLESRTVSKWVHLIWMSALVWSYNRPCSASLKVCPITHLQSHNWTPEFQPCTTPLIELEFQNDCTIRFISRFRRTKLSILQSREQAICEKNKRSFHEAGPGRSDAIEKYGNCSIAATPATWSRRPTRNGNPWGNGDNGSPIHILKTNMLICWIQEQKNIEFEC